MKHATILTGILALGMSVGLAQADDGTSIPSRDQVNEQRMERIQERLGTGGDWRGDGTARAWEQRQQHEYRHENRYENRSQSRAQADGKGQQIRQRQQVRTQQGGGKR